MKNQLPKILRDDPAIAPLLVLQERAQAALLAAEAELRNAKRDAGKCIEPVEFDEAGATARHARAKAHDAVHGVDTAGQVSKDIALERAKAAKACSAAREEISAARARVDLAECAVKAAESVWHDLNGQIFGEVARRSDELLPQLTQQSAEMGVALFKLVRVIAEVSKARSPADNIPKAYVEIAMPYLQGRVAGTVTEKVRVGSSRSGQAFVFED